jgi:hypothetical protein
MLMLPWGPRCKQSLKFPTLVTHSDSPPFSVAHLVTRVAQLNLSSDYIFRRSCMFKPMSRMICKYLIFNLTYAITGPFLDFFQDTCKNYYKLTNIKKYYFFEKEIPFAL